MYYTEKGFYYLSISALNLVFGSFYCDEVALKPKEIVSVLATATMFQLDGLIEQCAQVMLETLNTETVVQYYIAAHEYGLTELKNECVNWLLVNLTGRFYSTDHFERLRTIPKSLMITLISHPDLCVLKTEIILYTMLVQWMYLQLHLKDEIPSVKVIENYFSSRNKKTPFLSTESGKPFVQIFKALRLTHMTLHNMDIKLILMDNIIPVFWIHRVVFDQWKIVLRFVF